MSQEEEEKIILIAGGSYAPPHLGHLNTWCKAADAIKIANPRANIKIVVCPVGDIYDKASVKLFNYELRKELLSLLKQTRQDYNIEISDINKELQHDTYNEIKLIHKEHGIKPYVIFGADNMIGALTTWKLPTDELILLLKDNTFVVSCSTDQNDKRGSCTDVETLFNNKKKPLNISSNLYTFTVERKYSNMSSSEIIKALKLLSSSSENIKALELLNSTIPYIMENQDLLDRLLRLLRLTSQVKDGGRPRKRKTSKKRKTSRKRKNI